MMRICNIARHKHYLVLYCTDIMAESYIIVINQFLNYYMEVKVMLKVLIIYAKLGKLLKKFFF